MQDSYSEEERQQIHILLVDDDPYILNLLTAHLEDAGYAHT